MPKRYTATRHLRFASMAALLAASLILSGCASDTPPLTYPAAPPKGHAHAAYPESYGSGAPAAPLKSAFLRYYRHWAGVPYRYGGTSKTGIDCSAFVKQATASVRGVWLPRTTYYQARRGYAIPRSQLRIGDLVFFKTGGGSRHVGIYIGNGRFMHASSSSGVTISRMGNVYWSSHFWQARRLPGHRAVSSRSTD